MKKNYHLTPHIVFAFLFVCLGPHPKLYATKKTPSPGSLQREKDVARALAGDKNLVGADLSYSNLESINLAEANLEGANISYSSFMYADLSKASMKNIKAYGTNFTYASLNNADLTNAYLNDANFSKTNMQHVTVTNALLNNAIFSGTDLAGTNLKEAHISTLYYWKIILFNWLCIE